MTEDRVSVNKVNSPSSEKGPDDAAPRRIVVWGVTGSGKTTFAKRLGILLGLPVMELDAIRHRNGWNATDWPEFREILTNKLDESKEGWIVEGSYHQIMDVYLSRAEALVWINLTFRVSFWRLLKRTLSRGWTRTRLYTPDGPHESLRMAFTSKESILWWAISTHRRSNRSRRERIAALRPEVLVYELTTVPAVKAFLAAFESSARVATVPSMPA
jgi:adenylate kinase family enzyme